MKTTTFGLAVTLLTAACAQSQPAVGDASQAATDGKPVTSASSPEPTSSNPRTSLPAMSADRCVAEAIGTATDPKTGAPASSAVDPQTGKPLCPTEQQSPEPR